MEEEEVEVISCEDCGEVLTEDTRRITADDFTLCEDCSARCDRCGDLGRNDDYCSVGNEYWCEDCRENNSWYCNRCDRTLSEDYTSYEVGSDYWCEDCESRHAIYCEDCDIRFAEGDSCDECGYDGNGRNSVHEYSYKPNPVFRGDSKDRLYFGFELEIEIQNRRTLEASKLVQPLEDSDICYLKQDSSIGRNGAVGFELVTHPATHNAYRDDSKELWDYIEALRTDYKGRSWDTDTCGLHIHISRAGFSSGAHTHRFLAFIYRNSEMMMKFAGRKSDYAKFNDCYTYNEFDRPVFSLAHKMNRRAFTERYSAVNTQNEDTLEMRFFRGTMRREGILSALDLAHASVEYTRHLTVSDVRLGAYDWEWFNDWVADRNGIYPDLYQRLPKIAGVNLKNKQLIEA